MHAHAFHAHARAHRIHVLVAAHHRHLRALARFPRRIADLHRAVVNLRYFHFEQPLHQTRVRARHNHLRPLRRSIHCFNHHPQPLADVVGLQLRLLALWQPRFRPAHVHDQVRTLGALHNHGHQLPDAPVVLIENGVAFRLADFLQNHLLSRLRRNTSQHISWLRRQDFRADLGRRILLLRVGYRHLFLRIGHFLDDDMHRIHVHLARFRVELPAQVFLCLIEFPGRYHHRIFDRRHHHFRLDVLLAAQHLDLLVKQIRHIASLIPGIPALSL